MVGERPATGQANWPLSRCRLFDFTTAAAPKLVPSLNSTPSRSLMVTVLPSCEMLGIEAAGWGMTFNWK
jgi:hypothetical protein